MRSTAIRQFNLRKSKPASVHVIDLSSSLKNYIWLLHEPKLDRSGKVCLLDKSQHIISAAVPGCRAAIFAHASLNIWPVHSLMSKDVAVAHWDTGRHDLQDVLLVSCYWDGTIPALPPSIEACSAYCRDHGLNLLLGIDSNAHSPLWDGNLLDARGEALETLLMDLELEVLNDGVLPTFAENNKSSYIDITACSPSLSGHIPYWYVDPNYSHSDHRVICTELSSATPTFQRKRSTRDTDWPLHEQLEQCCPKSSPSLHFVHR